MGGPNIGETNSGMSLRLFREFAEYAPNDNSQARLTESSSPVSRGLTSHDVSGTGSVLGRGFERFTRTVGGFFQLLGHKILPGKVAESEKNRQVRDCFVAAIRSELSSAGIDWRTDIPKAIRDQFKNEMETNTPLTRRRIKQILSKVDKVLAYKNGKKAANAAVDTNKANLQDLQKAEQSLDDLDKKVRDLKIGYTYEEIEGFEKDFGIAKAKDGLLANFKKAFAESFDASELDKMTFGDAVKKLEELEEGWKAGPYDEGNDLIGAKNLALNALHNFKRIGESQNQDDLDVIKKAQDELDGRVRALAHKLLEEARGLGPGGSTAIPEDVRDCLSLSDGEEKNKRLDAIRLPKGEQVPGDLAGVAAVKVRDEFLAKIADLKSRLTALAGEVSKPVDGLTDDENVDLSSATEGELVQTSGVLSQKNVERQKRNSGDRAKIAALQKELKELQTQFEDRFALPKAIKEEGKVFVRPQTLGSDGRDRKLSDVRKDVREQVLVKIPGFDEWARGLSETIGEKLKLKDKALEYFKLVWAADMTRDQGMDLIAEKAVEVFSAAKVGNPNAAKVELDVGKLKDEIEQKLLKRYEEESTDGLWAKIDEVDEKFKKANLTKQTDDVVTDWKTKCGFQKLEEVLSPDTYGKLGKEIAETGEKFAKLFQQNSLLSSESASGAGKTLFNLIVKNLHDTSEQNVSGTLQAIVRSSLDKVVAGYRLEKDDGTVKSNLKPTRLDNREMRIVQGADESPHEIIKKLLDQKGGERTGIVQFGGLSCWMVSVVNGLLNSERGRTILRDCFKEDGSCAFKARNKDGGLTEIVVSKEKIDVIMQRDKGKKAISRLEAAIWLGVNEMSGTHKDDFTNVKGCNFGDMGEASDAATLFGLVNTMGTGAFDDDSVWVSGANSLHKGEIVVVHRRRKGANDGGHYMAIVGSELKRGGDAPEKTLDVYDSLQQNPTEKIRHDQLNSIEDEGADKYRVFSFSFP